MGNVLVLWSVGAGAAGVLAVLCGLMWLSERRETANLMLCLLGIATAVSAYAELGMMHSTTPEALGAWLRWYHLPIFLALVAQVVFVRYYLKADLAWLLWGAILARCVVLVVNFAVYPNFNFLSIDSLRTVSFLGDQISAIGAAVPRTGMQSFAIVSLVLLFAYVAIAVGRSWARGGADRRRRALAVGISIALPMLWTFIYTQLVAFGVLHTPITNIPWLLGSLLIMAYVSGYDLVQTGRARLEAAELRIRLAQIERVSLMGQLASALAHELSQPLSAIALNVGAGRRQLKQDAPDLAEIGHILHDVGADQRRAVETFDRIRQLFKRRAINLNPIDIDEVVRNVVALVSAEANAKHVVLRWQIEPDLPRVAGDPIHLSQVLLNLVMNSVQAVQSRPIDARLVVVEARLNHPTDEIAICVQDSGPGIPGAIVDRIFEPLFTTKPDGMGMGLALSHTIIEAHGGRLWADRASEREGATFRFTLRRAPA